MNKNKTRKLSTINIFYTFENPILHRLIKYESNSPNALDNLDPTNVLIEAVPHNEFNSVYERINVANKKKTNLLYKLGLDKVPLDVQVAVNDFTRGINKYLWDNWKKELTVKPSNAFTKLWEIYKTFDFLLPQNSSSCKILHICEAPGQMILATKYFIEKNRKHLLNNYEWRANSLNPYNGVNLEKYGAVFTDEYGMIKNNYTRWWWGADGTGDITSSNNVRWFMNKVEKWGTLGLIVGDGGMDNAADPQLLQLLDLAQAIMVAACSSVGSHCVIKHFTPFIPGPQSKSTYGATEFFCSLIYLYYTLFESVYLFKPYSSSSESGEFYLIGKNFKGCSDECVEKLLTALDTFTLNGTLWKTADLPIEFTAQIYSFLDAMSIYNANSMNKAVSLLNCKSSKKKKSMKCSPFLDEKYMKSIQISRYREWCSLYEFD